MSDETTTLEGLVSQLLGRVGDISLALLKMLAKLPPILRLFIFISMLILSLYGFYRWNAIRQSALSASFAALSGKVEATAQAYKGIEALVLAGTQDELQSSKTLTDECSALFITVVNDLKNPHKPPFPISKLAPVVKADGSYWEQFLTLRDSEALEIKNTVGIAETHRPFIFVPGISLRTISPLQFPVQAAQAGRVADSNLEILQSLASVMAIWRLITEFTGKQLFKESDASIVQSFFILSTGVSVIHQAGIPEDEQQEHYKSQFTGHTFLPDRPYFWEAVDTRRARTEARQAYPELT